MLCTSEGEYHAIPAKAREAEEDEEEVSRVDLSRIILQVDFEEELLSFKVLCNSIYNDMINSYMRL